MAAITGCYLASGVTRAGPAGLLQKAPTVRSVLGKILISVALIVVGNSTKPKHTLMHSFRVARDAKSRKSEMFNGSEV